MLLQAPCEAVGADSVGDGSGDYTVRTLSKGYVVNTSCIRKWELLLDKQVKHKQKMLELYNAK